MECHKNRMSMKNFMAIFIVITCALLGACTNMDTESAIMQAESDLQTGNIDLAASGCDQLTDTASNSLTFTQMCRVAIIYAKISELSDDHNYMVTATECLDKAIEMAEDSDSLESYIGTLDIENQNVVSSIREVSQALKNPQELGAGDYEESDENFDPLHHSNSHGTL